MGSDKKVYCLTCETGLCLGKWDYDLAQAICRGSAFVKKVYHLYRNKTHRYRYNDGKEFAKLHTDKGHKVIEVKM